MISAERITIVDSNCVVNGVAFYRPKGNASSALKFHVHLMYPGRVIPLDLLACAISRVVRARLLFLLPCLLWCLFRFASFMNDLLKFPSQCELLEVSMEYEHWHTTVGINGELDLPHIE